MDSPLVTVYIPCRNYGRHLGQAVESVLSQLYQNWELFIIDEASEDDTPVVAERLRLRDPDRITVIQHPEPVGLQTVANRILRLAQGRYIMRLDADDWLDEGALLLMVAKLESDASLGLVYGNYYYTDAEGRVIGMERRRKLGVEDVSGHLPPHGACTMVRTRALKSVGGYSEDVDAQDGWELWFKLINRVKAASIDAPLFYYRQHATSLSRDSNRLLQARAKILQKARSHLEGSYIPSCLAVIPVRESYPGWEGIPYREIGGKSLLHWALESAQQATGVTEVAVSSISSTVLSFAEDLVARNLVGEHLRIVRPEALAGHQIRARELLLHAADVYREKYGTLPDILMFLNLHAPMRRALHVDKAIDVLRITTSDSVVSVCEEHEPMFSHGRSGLQLLNPGRFEELTLERERLYRFNGAVVAVWYEVLASDSLFGESIGHIEMSIEDSVQVKRPSDLDTLIALLT